MIIGILKLIGALDSNSSGLFAEAAHSFADTGNQMMLLIGARLALRLPSKSHPFGYGKDRYFWTFLAAIAMFTIGATFSVYQGVSSLSNSGEVHASNFNYVILGIAAVLETVALSLALRATWSELRSKGMWSAIRDTKDPTRYIVVLEDSVALIGIGLVAGGLVLSQVFESTMFDGIAAILIGLLLAGVALLLGYESRSLLLGESVSPQARRQIISAIKKHSQVKYIVNMQTMHIGPDSVIVGLELDLDAAMTMDDAEQLIVDVEASIRKTVPEAEHIFIEVVRPGRQTILPS
ncbi:MAG: cation diffusion facilitator family transporter [Chloroflexi bacterium]|nr:cation diffusion facilitator family transporter [Chloroflexota bacterium]